MSGSPQGAGFFIFFEADDLLAPTISGMEYTAEVIKLEYNAPSAKLEYSARDSKLEYTAE